MKAALRLGIATLAGGILLGILPRPLAAQSAHPARILVWIESDDAPTGRGSWLSRTVGRFTEAVIRGTSPDIAREQRRLWVLAPAQRSKCLLSTEIGVHEPRWGKAGYILFLAESDSNGDGFIDFKDEYAVKILPENGGEARQIGRGRSAVWSPDGRLVAILSDRGLTVVNMAGQTATSGARGKLIVTDSRLPELARSAWAVRVRDGAIEAIDAGLTRRLQWLGSAGADGETIVYPNTQRTDLFIAPRGEPAMGQNITNDAYLDLDPSWSPDQKRIIYVSTNSSDSVRCH